MEQSRCAVCGAGLPPADQDLERTHCPACQAPIAAHPAAGDEPAEDPLASLELPPGFTARYQLGPLLGAGTCASVFWARDLGTHRPVAIKFLTQRGMPDVRNRFVREGLTLREIRSPGVLSVLDVSEAPGTPYLVMEYVAGGSLRQRLDREKRLSAAEAVRIGIEVATGLDAIHQRGIVHRDLKPANVLLDLDGRAVLADLGVAKDYSRKGVGDTATGALVGSPLYMAPEQLRGEPVGIAADVYSVGVILYEMLSGKVPYPGKTIVELFQMHETLTPTPIQRRAHDVPVALSLLVHRALSMKIAERPATAQDLVMRLTRCQAMISPTAAGRPARPPATPPSRSVRAPAERVDPAPAPPPITTSAPPPVATPSPAPAPDPVAGPDPSPGDPEVLFIEDEPAPPCARQEVSTGGTVPEWAADAALIELVPVREPERERTGAAEGRPGTAPSVMSPGTEEVLASTETAVEPPSRPAPAPIEPRAGRARTEAVPQEPERIPSAPVAREPRPRVEVTDEGLSVLARVEPDQPPRPPDEVPPSTSLVAAGAPSSTAPAESPPEGLTLGSPEVWGGFEFRHASAVTRIAFTPDGQRIIATDVGGSCLAWERTSGAGIERLEDAGSPLGLSRDGASLLDSRQGELRLVDVASGLCRWRRARPEHIVAAAMSPAAGLLALARASGDLVVCALSTGEPTRIVRPAGARLASLELSADGTHGVSAVTGLSKAVLWDVKKGTSVLVTHPGSGNVSAVAITDDGRLAISAAGSSLLLWDTGRATKQAELPAGRQNPDVWTAVALSADGSLAAAGNRLGDVSIWDVRTSQLVSTLPVHTRQVTALAFAPDGQHLVSGSVDCAIRLVQLPGGAIAPLTPGHSGPLIQLAFEPTGRVVLTSGRDGTAALWLAASGKLLRRQGGRTLWNLPTVALSSDGRLALSGDRRRSPLWQTRTGESAWAESFREVASGRVGFRASPSAVLVATDHAIIHYSPSTGLEARQVSVPRDLERTLAFVDDGKTLLYFDRTRKLRTLNTETGAVQRSFPEQPPWLEALPEARWRDWDCHGLSPDGRHLVLCESGQGVWVCDLRSGKSVGRFPIDRRSVTGVAVCPSGVLVLLALRGGRLELWDVPAGRCVSHRDAHEAPGHGPCELGPLAFLPDGRGVLAATDRGPLLRLTLQ